MYLCLNRGDVDPKSQQQSAEAVGRSLVFLLVDHVFLCIKDAEFHLDLLMQSLLFLSSNFHDACVSDGESANYLTKILIGGLFLRDPFSRSPCALIQPSMKAATEDLAVPNFGCTLDLPTLSSGQAIPKTTTFVLKDSYPVPTTHGMLNTGGLDMGLWNCVEGKDVSLDVAMVSADGKPLITIPPHGGIVRIGVACEYFKCFSGAAIFCSGPLFLLW
ncbi:unnamed protein product [Brassica rapa subsp. trilocularis]